MKRKTMSKEEVKKIRQKFLDQNFFNKLKLELRKLTKEKRTSRGGMQLSAEM